MSELAVQNAFYASAESQALYGTLFGITQINAIYVMLFGRAAEPAGLTTFNSYRSTTSVNVSNPTNGGVFRAIGDGVTSNPGTLLFGYAAATAATLNIAGGYKGVGNITLSGTGVVDLSVVVLSNTITTIDASAQTAGGLKVQAGISSTLIFKGGAGADSLQLGTLLTAGASVDGGAGTDTLVFANAGNLTAVTGAFIKNFEVLNLTTDGTADMDNLSANNTLTGLRLGGSATVSNINAATTANITVFNAPTIVFNVKGATTPGQLDTVTMDVNDGLASVGNYTFTAPPMPGVETLNIKARDGVFLNGFANLQALSTVTVTGAGQAVIAPDTNALSPNFVFDANTATGGITFAAGVTNTNGFT